MQAYVSVLVAISEQNLKLHPQTIHSITYVYVFSHNRHRNIKALGNQSK